MKKTVIIATIGILGIMVSQTQAALIEISIEAEIDWVYDNDGYLEGRVEAGDIITGVYKYNSDTPDTSPANENWWGLYKHLTTPYGIKLETGGLIFESDPSNVDFEMYIINNNPTSGKDNYNIRSLNNLPITGGVEVNRIVWQIIDESGLAIQTIHLPITSPVLNDWQDENSLRIEGVQREAYFVIESHVISAILIPEPTSIVLLAFGFINIRNRKSKPKQ